MNVPPKRKSNRSERRATQRGQLAERLIPAPPENQCEPWHYYWCEGHEDWHHHAESAVLAIQESLSE